MKMIAMTVDSPSNDTGGLCRNIFDDNRCTTLLIVKIVFAILAICGCIFLIFVLWLFNKRSLFYQILLYIALGNILRSIVIVILPTELHGRHPWCIIQGILIQFTSWAIITWELCLTVHVYVTIFCTEETKHRQRIYHVACWGTSIIFSIIPLIPWEYGPAVTWCWLKDPVWRIATLYAEYMVFIVVIFILYVIIIVKIYRKRTTSLEEHRNLQQCRKRVRPMILYPCVIILEGILPLAFRFHNIFNSDEDASFPFTVAFAVGFIFWGWMFVTVYVLDPATRQDLLLIPGKCRERWGQQGIQEGLPPSSPTPQKGTNTDRTERDAVSISVISIAPSTKFVD
ncbi:Cyclic AMP receptor-like protein A [Holothuria leucospilota]|uniref:Cyclic AMP receptor-like protein A n=1 Tax=Holothuria leucospilota TaxID=206669 RepID=A0A9Q1BS52_HOLLE|nr:Cyclic AMP receptor-like protein A [Holothuria leucospilota]